MGNTQNRSDENKCIRVVIMGDVKKHVIYLEADTNVLDLIKYLGDNLEVISPYNSTITSVNLDDFNVDVNNMNTNNNLKLDTFGNTVIVTITSKYEITEFIDKQYSRAITQKDKNEILDCKLSMSEWDICKKTLYNMSPELDNVRLLQYEKYNKAKYFFELIDQKISIWNNMTELEKIIRQLDSMLDNNYNILDKVLDKQSKVAEKCETNNSEIEALKDKILAKYNKNNKKYLGIKLEIDVILGVITNIENEIDEYLKDLECEPMIYKSEGHNKWLSKGGHWKLSLKNNKKHN